MHEGNPVLIIQIGGNGVSTARLYIFVECASRYFNKIKRTSRLGRLFALSLEILSHYKKLGYNINVLQQAACLVVNPITDYNFAFLFNCTPVSRTSDSMTVLL